VLLSRRLFPVLRLVEDPSSESEIEASLSEATFAFGSAPFIALELIARRTIRGLVYYVLNGPVKRAASKSVPAR
jgi:hypothetical protein